MIAPQPNEAELLGIVAALSLMRPQLTEYQRLHVAEAIKHLADAAMGPGSEQEKVTNGYSNGRSFTRFPGERRGAGSANPQPVEPIQPQKTECAD